MSVRKRNEYLDAESSDDGEKSGYDSSAAEETVFSRTRQPGPKRRKLSRDSPSMSTEGEEVAFKTDSQPTKLQSPTRQISPLPHASEPKNPASTSPLPRKPLKSKRAKPLSAGSHLAHKPGIVYLSRIPPFMRPPTLRRLLSVHGTILRVFLTPEPHSAYLARRSMGGNKKRSFIDGWVEFSRRKDARVCAEAINAQTIGGRGWYGDDLWNVRYLKGFSWDDLMTGVQREEREREEKIRVGLGREGRERAEFLRGVERGKIEQRRKEKSKTRGKIGEDEINLPIGEEGVGDPERRDSLEKKKNGKSEKRFRQNETKGNRGEKTAQQPSEDVKRVLSKIF
ncbi:RNA-binding ATPase activator esf2 [Pseudocyphellaria aurata]|nr:RNA-binding ATPase activator esf2 [Pseudocyphellaria aurata]